MRLSEVSRVSAVISRLIARRGRPAQARPLRGVRARLVAARLRTVLPLGTLGPGRYRVRLIAVDRTGNRGSASVTVAVPPPRAAPRR